ncbi:MAG: FGGY family carbohydrate kinase [Saprospiraceae bacterium]
MPCTAIFDIGKTNKKFFLFDENYKEVFKTYAYFDEIKDADGFPCDDLLAIEKWIKSTLKKAFKNNDFKIGAINFSTYGASFVHVDKNGKTLTPLYNYLKPFPKKILQSFYKKYGSELMIAKETASPQLGMLNSGMQLYWLKYAHPDIFKKIRWSLHFPQYLSYLLTGIPLSDFTSIGCHTGLWDFVQNDYHRWVYEEGIDRILPPIVSAYTSVNTNIFDKKIKTGIGVHDSSSVLEPYLRADKKPFLLISTGTWSIALNPFNKEILSEEELKNDCLNYMTINGQPVKAARLFLGNEFNIQLNNLDKYFNEKKDAHLQIKFSEKIFYKLNKNYQRYFSFDSIQLEREQPKKNNLNGFKNYEEAYHQLMMELVEMQEAAAKRAIGKTKINKLYIDGGFADNDLFVKMLSRHFPKIKIRTTQSPLGSALGAAMVLSDDEVQKKFLKKHYAMKKISDL